MVPVLWVRKKAGPGCNASVIAWLPSVKDLPIGEHILYAFPGASRPRQEDQPLPLPAPVTTNPAAIGRFGEWLAREMPPGTVIGQPLHWAPRIVCAVLSACQEVEPTPPPAPAGGLVERVVGVICKTCNLELEARAAIHAVADWLQQRSSTIANGSQWAEMLRREADR